MNTTTINWKEIPDVLTKEQFRLLCHISKETARSLLKSGVVPCLDSGKQTRCYKIKKTDVQTYLKEKEYCKNHPKQTDKYKIGKSTADVWEGLRGYYEILLANVPDLLSSEEVSMICGYGRSTVNTWCQNGRIKHYKINRKNMIPITYLIDFFCSPYSRSIAKKSEWHRSTLDNYSKRNSKRKNN